ncbi:MAG: PAS domain S-box protein [Acidobacteriota bacterium]
MPSPSPNEPGLASPVTRWLHSLFMRSGWGIAIGSTDGQTLMEVNPAFATMHGYAHPDELRGRPTASMFTPQAWVAARSAIAKVNETGHQVFESVHVRRDGSEFPVLIDATLVEDESLGEHHRVVSVQDISSQKAVERALRDAHDQLRTLSAHHDAVLEEERRQIAREVHDELGQLLTGLKMEVSTLGLRFGSVPGMSDAIDDMQGQLVRIMTVVRQVAGNLRPAVLDLGLLAAVEWLVDEYQRRCKLACEIVCPAGDAVSQYLSPHLVTVAFRCVQESLTNIARHAHASRVTIGLIRQNDVLSLSITDNGKGFDSADVMSRSAFGLRGMRERVQAQGGQLSVISRHGAGTTIDIQLPLNKEQTP